MRRIQAEDIERTLSNPHIWATELFRRAGWLRERAEEQRQEAERQDQTADDFRTWAEQKRATAYQLDEWAKRAEVDGNQALRRESAGGQEEPGAEDEDPLDDGPELTPKQANRQRAPEYHCR